MYNTICSHSELGLHAYNLIAISQLHDHKKTDVHHNIWDTYIYMYLKNLLISYFN